MNTDDTVNKVAAAPGIALGPAPGGSAKIGVDSDALTLQFYASGQKAVIDDTNTQSVGGAKTFTGSVAFTGAMAGARRSASVTTAATATLTTAQSGLVVIATRSSSTQVFTLPAAATAGLMFTFVCGHASGEIQVGVATGDNIVGKTSGADTGTGLVSTATTGLLKNTAATNVVGDHCQLVSDGITTWYMMAVAGVWSVT